MTSGVLTSRRVWRRFVAVARVRAGLAARPTLSVFGLTFSGFAPPPVFEPAAPEASATSVRKPVPDSSGAPSGGSRL